MNMQPSYRGVDRLLHRVAFSGARGGVALQRMLAEVEDSMLARNAPATPPPKPLFVAALSRAGTTLLLNLLAGTRDFATHTYREMPFVLCPLLWSRLSHRFREQASERERAHGDGMLVGYDSPEAFEEVLWMTFWQDKYRDRYILPWTPEDRNAEFEAFFARHMRKILALRAAARAGSPPTRYLSKNYANIARLTLLPVLFPDCRIVVPVRDPWSHANSLLNQHRRFSELHARDDFARRYMGWLGHFEFGAELRPIRFTAEQEEMLSSSPDGIDFWLRYWIFAHETIKAAVGPHVVLVDYAALCADPAPALDMLVDTLGIEDADGLRVQGERIRQPTSYADAGGDPSLRRRAADLYEALRGRCLNSLCSSSPCS